METLYKVIWRIVSVSRRGFESLYTGRESRGQRRLQSHANPPSKLGLIRSAGVAQG
jgi:hypothetical protein